MPVIIEIIGNHSEKVFQEVFDYFKYVDDRFSPYKAKSEVSLINSGQLKIKRVEDDMKLILKLAQETKEETNGYFDIYRGKYFDPSGIVKGWAIHEASKILDKRGCKNYYISAGGDIQTSGVNKKREKWKVGIRNPFNIYENVKTVSLSGEGIATSGTYEKGSHIYNPKQEKFKTNLEKIVSLTVIASNVYEADRFATAAFAMGIDGINFIERKKDLEGYMIDSEGIATFTSGFENYVEPS